MLAPLYSLQRVRQAPRLQVVFMRNRYSLFTMNNDSNKTVLIIVVLVALFASVGVLMYYQRAKIQHAVTDTATTTPDILNEQAVRDVVTKFGTNVKMVPLTASSTAITNAIQTYYSEYVAPELIAEWTKTPTNAPGRRTSSPWPDHIDILSASKSTDTMYIVRGNMIEKTSVEEMNGGSSGAYPVSFVVENRNGKWLITRYETTEQMQSS